MPLRLLSLPFLMDQVTPAQFFKLHTKVLALLKQAKGSDNEVVINAICTWQFYQTVRELELIILHYPYALKSLGEEKLSELYRQIFIRWRNNARWLHRYHLKRPIL